MDNDPALAAAALTYVMETAPVVAFQLDAQQCVVAANAQAQRLLGPAVVGRSWGELVLDATHRAAGWPPAQGSAEIQRLKLTTVDGAPARCSCRFFPLPVGTLVLGTFDGPDQHDQVAAARRQNAERQLAILDTIPDPAWAKDRDGRFAAVNRAWCEFTGFPREQALGRGDSDIFSPEAAARFQVEERAVIETGQTHWAEQTVPDGRGRNRWFETFQVPLLAATGQISGTIGIAREITQRKQAEAALRESQRGLARYQLLSEHAQDIFLFVRPGDGRILEANRAACEAYGYASTELLEKTIFELHAEDPAAVSRQLQQAEQAGVRFEALHRRRDGSTFPVEVHSRAAQVEGEPVVLSVARDLTVRKRMERELRQTHEQLGLILDSLPVVLYAYQLDQDFTVSYIGPNCAQVTGFSAQQFLAPGNLRARRLHPEDAARVLEEAGLLLTDGYFAAEYRWQLSDGSYHWFYDAAQRIQDAAGGTPRAVGIWMDITTRKRTEQRLRESQTLLESLVEGATSPIYVKDLQGRYLLFNSAAERVTKVSRADILGRDDRRQFSLEEARILMERDQAILAAGVPAICEEQVTDAEGVVRQFLSTKGPLRDERGQAVGLWGISHDITERKQAEQELQRIYQLVPDMICQCDRDGRFTKLNPAWERTLGYAPDELLGRPYSDLIHPDDLSATTGEVAEQLREGRQTMEFVNRYRHQNGSYLWLEWAAFAPPGLGLMFGIARDVTQRKEAELAIQRLNVELEQRVRERTAEALELYHQAPCGYHALGPEGLILQINDTELQWLGYPREEVEGRLRLTELMTAEDAARFEPLFRAFVEHGTTASWEWDLRCKAGSSINVLINVEAVREAQGRFVQGRCTALNITQRKRAEVALQASEARLEAVLQNAPFGFWARDLEGRCIMANDFTLRNFGPLLGKRVEELDVPAATRAIWQANNRRVLAGEVVQGEVDFPLAGEQHSFFNVVAPFRVGDEIQGVLEFNLDITDLKQATETLRKLSRAVEFSPSMIQITDAQGCVEYVNPAWEQVTGYRLEQVTGQKPSLLRSGIHTREFYAHLWSEITAGRVWRGEFCNRRKSGELYWEAAAIAPVQDDAGRITHFVAVKEDSTARRQAERELQEAKEAADTANRAKGAFLASMSHEIRTPMNAILGFSQLLLRDPQLTAQQRHQLTTITRSGEHLLEIINDILEMARIEAGRVTFHPVAFDLHLLLDDLERLFSLRTQAKQLQVRVARLGELPRWVLTDETKLRQVLINLLANAVNFTASGGAVTLRVRSAAAADGLLRLYAEVEDTGVGIAAEDLPHLFEPFYQAGTGRHLLGGTGLGLTISREFVHLLGGELTVTSQLGVGSSFRFDARLAPVEEAVAQARTGTRPRALHLRPDSPACRVLVADDQQDNCELLERILVPLGFEVRSAGDGAQAVAQCQAWSPHLVVLDLRMPVLDGYEAARRIRAAHGPAVKILVHSASAFAEDRQRATTAGADAFLPKPLQEAELLESIRQLTGVTYVYEAVSPPQTPAPAADAGPSARAVHHGRVLLAEDAVDCQELVRLLLIGAGVEADVADNGQQACRLALASAAEGRPYDLILMDVEMPELNGLEATQRLRQLGWQRPIVALTAHVLDEDRQRCLAAGCDNYLGKPVTQRDLCELLGQYLQPRTVPAEPRRPERRGLEPALLDDPRMNSAARAKLQVVFTAVVQKQRQDLERAWQAADRDRLETAARDLSGAAKAFGVPQLAEAAATVCEQLGGGARLTEMAQLLAGLTEACRQFVTE